MSLTYDKDAILQWCEMAFRRGGDFVRLLARAVSHADPENFDILRPVMIQIIDKYPRYLTWAREERAEVLRAQARVDKVEELKRKGPKS